ncbi:MAG: NAD(P)H-hydrate dehydratase [Candidatus Saganbacteria bacterium]|nr:NAD(P)H-hydrate dehydratase [Candidatus Saganbacteria bacterium]
MRSISTAEMKRIDARAINDLGIPQIVLMENAGLRVMEAIKENYGIPESAVVVCGKGSNGGDAAVIARHLYNSGCDVSVFLAGSKSDLKKGARINFQAAKNIGINIAEITKKTQLEILYDELQNTGIVIDGLFGIGLNSDVKGLHAEIIDLINNNRKRGYKTVSVDIPSGLDSDTGKIRGRCVEADMTVTFHLPKTGMLKNSGPEKSGKIVVGDISIPYTGPRSQDLSLKKIANRRSQTAKNKNLTDIVFVKERLPKRKKDSNKGDNGRVLIIAGSENMAGAAILTSKAALRAGSGSVYLSIPGSIRSNINKAVPEAITYFDLKVSEIKKMKLDAIAVGPGIGQGKREFVKKLIKADLPCPMVIDADGLNSIAGEPKVLLSRTFPTVITPHPGEMARLIKTTASKIQSDRTGNAVRFARKNNVIVVLKGFNTIISDQRGGYFINPTGNPGMASAGAGDVLTGIIVSLIGQGMETFDAAVCGAYIHGLSGDLAAKEKGRIGIIASDIIEAITGALKCVSA